MIVSPLGSRLMQTLRHRPASAPELAAAYKLEPWIVRQELDRLRSHRLIRDRWEPPRRLAVELTARGWAEVYDADQLQLDGVR